MITRQSAVAAPGRRRIAPSATSVLRRITIGLMDGDLYDGLPVDQLPIDTVDVPDDLHLRRSDRYRGAVDIEPEHAIEAVFDSRRLVARPEVTHR